MTNDEYREKKWKDGVEALQWLAVIGVIALAVLAIGALSGCVPLPPHYLDNGCVLYANVRGEITDWDCPKGQAMTLTFSPEGRLESAKPAEWKP